MTTTDWLALLVTGISPMGDDWLAATVTLMTNHAAPYGWGRLASRYADDANLDSRVIAAIALHETGRFRYGGTDPVFSANPGFHNFGGIKTTDGTATARFASDALGIRGLVAHVAWYAHPFHADSVCGRAGRGLMGQEISIEATEFDPRHFAWGHKGKLRTVADFGNGVWNTGPDYALAITRLIEEMMS